MAKQMNAAAEALISKAAAFKAKHQIADWGQDSHCLFIAKVASDCGMPRENIAAFHEQLKLAGLGGNASQFAQAAGFRSPKASTPTFDLTLLDD
jgi:hypothetical protein